MVSHVCKGGQAFVNVLKKVAGHVKKDWQKLKTLPPKQKFFYIIDYYKGAFFIFLCLGLLGYYIAGAAIEIRNDTVLEGFFSNDDENLFPAKEIAKDFSAHLGLGPRQQVIFDDSLYVIPESSAEYNAGSQGKIIAYIAARELDFLVTTKDLVEMYAPNCPVQDLEELLPDDLRERLQDQLLYGTDGSGAFKACGVSMDGSRFTKDSAAQKEAPHYLMVFSYTQHREALIRFLRYAFELE